MSVSRVPPSSAAGLQPLPPDPALETALVGLVADGTLTEEQARAVRAGRAGAARDAVTAPTAPAASVTPLAAATAADTAPPEAAPPAHPGHNPLPEILGYVGAVLVASALLNLVIQSWERWSDPTRLVLVVTGTVALYVAGLATAWFGGRRSGLAAGPPVRRRLVALLLAMGAAFAGLTTIVTIDAMGYPDASWVALASGCVAFTAATLGAWYVRGVLSTLAVAGASVWLFGGAFAAVEAPEGAWWVPLAVLAGGAAWMAAAPRLLSLPVLSEALGWAFTVQMLMPFALWMPPTPEEGYRPVGGEAVLDALQTQAWVARGVLVVLAVAGMVAFLRGGRWPWAAGGVASAVVATLAIGGQTLNWIMALLVAGVLLLLLSGILIAARRRSDRQRAAIAVPEAPPG